MLSVLWNLVLFIVTLSVLIVIHEFGHFWIARLCKVQVESFSIGFGKKLWHRIDRHGTEFIIAIIPIGGYVKMVNECSGVAVLSERRDYVFKNRAIWQRASIVASGSIANFISAIFFFWLAFIIGISSIRPIVGKIATNSIAEKAKIIPGMELKAIDGVETPDWNSVRLQLFSKIGDTQAIISVSKFGSSQRKEDKILDLRYWSFIPDQEDPVEALGIYPATAQIETVLIEEIQNCCAARKAGLKVGDKITRVDGKPLKYWETFVNSVRDHLNKPLKLDIERKGSSLSLTLIPNKKPGSNKIEGFAGVLPKVIYSPDNDNRYKIFRQYSPFSALIKATNTTWQSMRLTISILSKMITGNIKLDNLTGPISIAKKARISAEFGMVYYFMFLSFISVNLGIINLLPFPVLDGGHLLFLAIEKVKGSPISDRVQDFSYRIGSIFLALLMGLALFNDFSLLQEK